MIAQLAWLALGAAGFASTLFALRRVPPAARTGWAFVAAGVGVVFGTGVAIGLKGASGRRLDALWILPGLLAYPLLVVGLVGLRNATNMRRSTDVLDALVVALGAFLIGWLIVLRQHLHGHAPLIAATVGHDIGALVVLAVAVVVVLGRGLGRTAGALLIAAAAVLLALTAILAVSARPLTPTLKPSALVAVLWVVFQVLVATVGLTRWPPPRRRIRPSEPAPLTAWRVALILSLTVLGPVIWLVVVATDIPTEAVAESAVPVMGDAVLSILLLAGLVVTGAALQRLRDRLRYQATHDALTGLGNRAALTDALDEAFTGDDTSVSALLLIDLDGFKDINDRLGHPVGDAALNLVAGRLHHTVPASGVLSRLGGDEFAVLLPHAGDDEAAGLADQICEQLRQPYCIGEKTVHMSASIGLMCGTSRSPIDALRVADVALYAAKAAGRDQWVGYRDDR